MNSGMPMQANANPRAQATAGRIVITDAYARPAMHLKNALAAFMVIENTSNDPVTITVVRSSLDGKVFTHNPMSSASDNADANASIDLPPLSKTILKPGHLHIMMPNSVPSPEPGQQVELELQVHGEPAAILKLTIEKKPMG